jgi:hypothetical protein
VILFLPRGVLPTGGEYLTAGRAWWQRRRGLPARLDGDTGPATERAPEGPLAAEGQAASGAAGSAP